MERTLFLIKPDGVQRGLVGEILSRIERKGFHVVAMRLLNVTESMAKAHYEEHQHKPFYPQLISYITSGPVVAMCLEGRQAVGAVRTVVGKTDPLEALPGTIRGDLGMAKGRNLVHASDSVEAAQREISLFFSQEELVSYKRSIEEWMYPES